MLRFVWHLLGWLLIPQVDAHLGVAEGLSGTYVQSACGGPALTPDSFASNTVVCDDQLDDTASADSFARLYYVRTDAPPGAYCFLGSGSGLVSVHSPAWQADLLRFGEATHPGPVWLPDDQFALGTMNPLKVYGQWLKPTSASHWPGQFLVNFVEQLKPVVETADFCWVHQYHCVQHLPPQGLGAVSST